MRIIVNGQATEVRDGLTVAELVAELGVRPEFTAVAVNREIAPRARHATMVLEDDDRVEIVRPMAGGSGTAAGQGPAGRNRPCGTSHW